MTNDIIPCGFCKDEFTREEEHSWDNDFQCYLCRECTRGVRCALRELGLVKLTHHSHSTPTRVVSKKNPTRFNPLYFAE